MDEILVKLVSLHLVTVPRFGDRVMLNVRLVVFGEDKGG
jgi:hypothetical protein